LDSRATFNPQHQEPLSEEEKEGIKEKLKALGYL